VAFDIENPVGTGTDAELLEFTRAAIAEITLHGFMRTGKGRTLTKENLSSLREQVDWLESRIASADSSVSA
jgi:hypothetical protein